jgi:5-methylcytosine-specific restriction endonuclease McrA
MAAINETWRRIDDQARETAIYFGRIDKFIYPSVKREVFIRADNKCESCKRHIFEIGRLDMHHVRYIDNDGNSIRGGKETPDDLMAVCRNCHKKIHGH